MCKVENCLKLKLTVVAAQVGGAPGVRAQDGVSPMERSVFVWARVLRAECFAALLFLALAVVALHIMGVVDRRVAVGAGNGVTARRFYVVVGPMTRCVTGSAYYWLDWRVILDCHDIGWDDDIGKWRASQAIIFPYATTID